MKRFSLSHFSCIILACFALHARAADVPKDDPKRFLEAGIPASDREWIGADYERAAEVLTAKRVGLPELSDQAGAKLIERLTSVENLAILDNKTIPIGQRFDSFRSLLGGSQSVVKLYFDAIGAGQKLDSEFVRILAFVIRAGAKGIELADEYVLTIPKDAKYEARMAGLKKMRGGLTVMIVGAEQMLGEAHSPADLSIMLAAMESSMPVYKRAFTEDFRTELIKKLDERRAQFKDADAKRLVNMIAELKKE